jgi:uncharacterized protein YjbI with pentapeptide repeats
MGMMRTVILHLSDADIQVEVHDDHTAAHCLQHILIKHTNLQGADLNHFVSQWPEHQRSLSMLNWSNVDLTECTATGLDLSKGVFERTVLMRASLHHSNLSHSQFAGTILDAAGLDHCCMDNSDFVSIAQQGKLARHPLRPHMDEFLPFDRVLARSADFAHASLEHCVFQHVDFGAAMMASANLSHSVIEKCNFEGTVLQATNFGHCHVYRSDMISSTLSDSMCNQAVFRSNDYVQMPLPRTIADASFAFPGQFWRYLKTEYQHWRTMPAEICVDYQRVLLIKLLVISSVPLLAVLAWKYVATNAVMSLITAVGAVSTYALRRYFTMLLQAAVGFLFGKANDAEGLWRAGQRRNALVSIVTPGSVASRIIKLKRSHLTD